MTKDEIYPKMSEAIVAGDRAVVARPPERVLELVPAAAQPA